MRPMLDVVAGIIWRDGCYLAVERPKGANMAGWWEFPGGKIEPGRIAGCRPCAGVAGRAWDYAGGLRVLA